jgi:hypothetical protein
MPREKENYRDMLAEYKGRGLPDILTKKQAMEVLGCGHSYFERLVREGEIKTVAGKIPIGAIARLTCG